MSLLLLLILSLTKLSFSEQFAICSNGCQLLYHEQLPCSSHSAFIPNSYLLSASHIDIDTLLNHNHFICFDPLYSATTSSHSYSAQNNGVYYEADPNTFTLDAPVLIWQAVIISIIIPILMVIIFKLVLIFCNKCWDCMQHQADQDNHCCAYCLYCFSAQYRQRSRNRRFENGVYNNINHNDEPPHNDDKDSRKWWQFGRKQIAQQSPAGHAEQAAVDLALPQNHPGNIDNAAFVHVPMDNHELEHKNDNNENAMNERAPINENKPGIEVSPNVRVELSVDNNEVAKYLQAAGGDSQDVELSFSSQGLRRISYHDVV